MAPIEVATAPGMAARSTTLPLPNIQHHVARSSLAIRAIGGHGAPLVFYDY
jgi:hypothetical protein